MITYHRFLNEEKNEKEKKISIEQAKQIGNKINIDWNKIDIKQFRRGIEVELEHGTKNPETNITNDDLTLTSKIALAHLNEISDYYTRLDKMENDAKNGN